jgi:hypothetical protein
MTSCVQIERTNTCVSAVRHVRRLRGGSQAHLLEGSNGFLFATKFQNNPQHIKVLANEMLAGQLGRYLGLPVPSVEPINVPAWLINRTSELRIETARAVFPCSPGLQVGSRYVCASSDAELQDYLPDEALASVVNADEFARCLVFDKWTANCDGRQAVFDRLPSQPQEYSAYFIDQGFCFNAGEWNFPDAPLRGTYARIQVYRMVSGWEAFEPALSLAEEIDIEEIWRCALRIPPEWYEHDSDGLSRLCECLYRRRLQIRHLISAFRDSHRNPFPNWVKH